MRGGTSLTIPRQLPTVAGLLLLVFAICTQVSATEFAPWGGAAVSDWSLHDQSVMVSDMAQGDPKNALSPMALKKGCWKVIPYEFVGGATGNMVFAPPEANAPELTVPLNVEKPGWYAVFVGLFSTSEAPTEAWLRLDGDPASIKRENRSSNDYGNSEEVFLKVAELSKTSCLKIAQQTTGFVCGCGVTHVRLIPLSPDEVQRHLADRADASHRTQVGTIDGFSSFYHNSPRTKEALLSQVEIFRNTDFGTLILQSPGGDKVNYASQIGYMKGSHAEEFPRVGDRHFVESIRDLAAKGINPLKVLIDGAHAVGMKVHVAIRPAGWSFFEPYTDYWESPFYKDHPEWRCTDRDGTPVTRMSWAVPEVRRHMIALLREQVSFGTDGAHVAFNRGYPVALYEAPARKLFQEKYEIDPRELPESDPRIVQWWSDIVVTFMRELRAMLDEEQKSRADGKRLELTIMVLGTANDDLRFGVDIGRLINEGLADGISTELGFGRTSDQYNLSLLSDACKSKAIPFYPGVTGNPIWFPAIPSYYDAGAKGIAVWDPETVADVFNWTWISRFGHAEETRYRLKNLQLTTPPRSVLKFHRLGDQIRDGHFGPFWGG